MATEEDEEDVLEARLVKLLLCSFSYFLSRPPQRAKQESKPQKGQ